MGDGWDGKGWGWEILCTCELRKECAICLAPIPTHSYVGRCYFEHQHTGHVLYLCIDEKSLSLIIGVHRCALL